MINSVSNVSFRGEVDAQALINSPGKYTTAAAPKAEAAADSFEKEGAAPKKKSKAPAIIGTIVGLAAAAYIALGIAVGKGKLAKAVPDEAGKIGFMGKVKNFFVSIGESADNLWSKIRGKKADDWYTGWKGWSVQIVLPLTVVGMNLLYFILGFVDRKHQTDYGIYFLLTIMATVLVVILVCVGVMHNTMLVTVTTGIGVLLLIAKIIFQGKTFLSELSRRLHV